MASYPLSTPGGRTQPLWLCLLLGLVFVVAGIVVLGDIVQATLISAVVIGIVTIASGLFELIHALWTKGWGGFIWQVVLGLLYIVAGAVLVRQPLTGALVLTWVLGIVLVASGVVRIIVGVRNWKEGGWLLPISGIFAVLAGIAILTGRPLTGLWVIGFLLGIDLIFHGIGWLFFAFQPAARATA